MARLRQLSELRHSRTSMGPDGDRPGTRQTGNSDPAPGPVERQACSFAADVALYVEDARLERRFDELILVAAPAFLACLRESLSQEARDAVIGEIGKDLVGAQQESLQEHVLRVL
jgi:protein required for attachment to host cells